VDYVATAKRGQWLQIEPRVVKAPPFAGDDYVGIFRTLGCRQTIDCGLVDDVLVLNWPKSIVFPAFPGGVSIGHRCCSLKLDRSRAWRPSLRQLIATENPA
jgi:hypothetical protein